MNSTIFTCSIEENQSILKYLVPGEVALCQKNSSIEIRRSGMTELSRKSGVSRQCGVCVMRAKASSDCPGRGEFSGLCLIGWEGRNRER